MKNLIFIQKLIVVHMQFFILPKLVTTMFQSEYARSFVYYIPLLLLLAIGFYGVIAICYYIYSMSKNIYLCTKGYQIGVIPFVHLIIQVKPRIRIRFSIIADYQLDIGFLPYNTLERVTNHAQLDEFLQDYIKSEKVGLWSLLVFCLSLITAQVALGYYLFLPHSLTLPIYLYLFHSQENEIFHGAIAKIKNLTPENFVYYIARNAVHLQGDRSWIYDLFQQKYLNEEIPDSFQVIVTQTWRHIFMEKITGENIDIDPIAEKRLLNEIKQALGFVFFSASEKFDLLKVIVCYGILTNNQEIQLAVKDCYDEISGGMNLGKTFSWHKEIAENQVIQKVTGIVKPEVIRRDVAFNKLDRYRTIENNIISKMRAICVEK